MDSNRNLQALPDSIGNLQSLTELSLYHHENLKSLPDTIGNLRSLKTLSLDWLENLQTIPDSIGNLQSLTKLSLYHHENLQSLPDTIGNLRSLKTLRLDWLENLQTLPESIGNLQSLTELYLDNNNSLQTLPEPIGNLQSIEKLSLTGNKNLKTLPDSIGNLKNLSVLDLQYSSIEQLPDSVENLSALKHVDICRSNIHSVPEFFYSLETFIDNKLIEMIPQIGSLSYRGFVNCYYTLIETLYRFYNKAEREGLLALEDELRFFVDGDFLQRGIRLMVDGTDSNVIRNLMTLHIEREHDFYRKKLMEIAMEGIMGIQAGNILPHRLIILLNTMVAVKNNPIDAACAKYFAGDRDSFSNIDFKAALQPEEEREEISFIKRAIELSEIARREGLLALEEHLDHGKIAGRDVFEYGLPLLAEVCDNTFINSILTCLVEHETDPVQKNIALAKKDAVLSIQAGENTRILALKLMAYFDKDIAKAAEEEFF